jgi:hypothetical protein
MSQVEYGTCRVLLAPPEEILIDKNQPLSHIYDAMPLGLTGLSKPPESVEMFR